MTSSDELIRKLEMAIKMTRDWSIKGWPKQASAVFLSEREARKILEALTRSNDEPTEEVALAIANTHTPGQQILVASQEHWRNAARAAIKAMRSAP